MATFTMPSLGADMNAGTVLEWLVQPGDAVHRGDIIAVVDTEKAAIEVECFSDGVVQEIVVEPGQKVAVGTVLATLADTNGAAAGPPPVTPPTTASLAPVGPGPTPSGPGPTPPEPITTLPAATSPTPPANGAPSASPLVRHLAAERGLDLTTIHGTGAGGAITRSDIEHIPQRASAPPAMVPPRSVAQPRAVAPPRTGRRRVSPLARRLAAAAGLDVDSIAGTGRAGTVRAEDVRRAQSDAATQQAAAVTKQTPTRSRPAPATTPPSTPPGTPSSQGADAAAAADHRDSMRQAIARLMSRSNAEIPHYYLTTTFEMTAAMEWLHARNLDLPVGGRLLPAVLLLKAAALAAQDINGLNGEWCDGHFRRAASVNLGVVTSVRGGGVMVPVITDAASLTLPDLMTELRGAVERVRFGRLRASELTGATITVTNLGEQGVESVYGVVFPPQVALVGFGAVVQRPWAVDGLLGVRPVLTATLAADHRASDGAVGARFLARVGRLMQKPGEL